MGLPLTKKIILFGAMDATTDARKGFKYLKSALDKFQKFDLTANEPTVTKNVGGRNIDLPKKKKEPKVVTRASSLTA